MTFIRNQRVNIWIVFFLIALFFGMGVRQGRSEIKYIDLTNPFLRKIPMAIPQFKALSPSSSEQGLTIPLADQFSEMLDFTGYFVMLDRASFLFDPQQSGIAELEINYGNWTAVGAELLITGGVQVIGGTLFLEMRLFDTFKQKMLIGKRYRGPEGDQRVMVRRFCTDVIQALTGSPGFFDSRFAFVSNGSGHKEIYTCDFDGTNVRQLTSKQSITTFPDWSWDGNYLAFTSYARGRPQVYIHQLATGGEKWFDFKGIQVAPSWAPGKFELAATLASGDDQEIYLLTGDGKVIKRLTNSPGIDIEVGWAPDGKRAAFVSKRAGTPQIYIMDVSNRQVRRLTYEGRYNTQPAWSPKGDKIAYSSMENGQLDIVVIDVNGRHPIQLTQNQGDNEAPSWSPDGSLIAFSSTRGGKSQIYVMTAFGTDQRRLLTLPGAQSHPVWSGNNFK